MRSQLVLGNKSLSTFFEIAKINGIRSIVHFRSTLKMSRFMLVETQQLLISEYPQTMRTVKCCIFQQFQPSANTHNSEITGFKENNLEISQRERMSIHLNRQIFSLCLVRSTSFLRIQVPQTHRVCSTRCNKSKASKGGEANVRSVEAEGSSKRAHDSDCRVHDKPMAFDALSYRVWH